jgi:hypothetical protein
MESCEEVEGRWVDGNRCEDHHSKSRQRSKDMHGPLSMVYDHVNVPFEGVKANIVQNITVESPA